MSKNTESPNYLRKTAVGLLCAVLVLTSCAPARMPLKTGEIPEARPLKPDEEQYGHQVLQALTEQYELDYNHPRYNEVVGIVEKLTAAADADKDPWHVFILRDNNLKNAAATRGNHVFVWTGMLDYTSSEAELATVISHEIAHVLARHTDPDPNEEARKLLIQVGAMAAAMAAAGATSSYQASQVVGNLTGAVTQEVASGMLIYPYTRDMELEADSLGMFIMAKAGYDPREALRFWEKAATDPDFSSSVEFLSSHPVASDRLTRLRQQLPEAEKLYHAPSSSRVSSDNSRNIVPDKPETNSLRTNSLRKTPLRNGRPLTEERYQPYRWSAQ